jgi:hypothetical protein
MDTPLTAHILERFEEINWGHPVNCISVPRDLLEDDHIETVAEFEALLKYIRAVKNLDFEIREIDYCFGENTFIVTLR